MMNLINMSTAVMASTLLVVVCMAISTVAFQPSFSVHSIRTTTSTTSSSSGLFAYVPDGFTTESYKKFKEQEATKATKKNLGRLGPKGFQSRSMQSFQEALERGEAAHLMPVFNSKERIARGEIRAEDVPVSGVTLLRGGRMNKYCCCSPMTLIACFSGFLFFHFLVPWIH
jgi:hypothetical protein